MSDIKLGVMLPSRNVVTMPGNAVATVASLIESAVELERQGFDSLWLGDSLAGRPRPEPLTLLAGIATVTRSIQLGTATVLPALRHPLQLAQQAATLDLIANGRLTLGIGTGFPNDQSKRELGAMGLDYSSRVERCHEVILACRSLWRGDRLRESRFWKMVGDGVTMEPLPAEEVGPDIWLGGSSNLACRTVGRCYDGWMPTAPDAEAFANGWSIVREEAQQCGRDPDRIVGATVLTIAVAECSTKARQTLRNFIEPYYSAPLERVETVVGCRSGSLAEIVDTIGEFNEMGVSHVIIRFASHDQGSTIREWGERLRDAVLGI